MNCRIILFTLFASICINHCNVSAMKRKREGNNRELSLAQKPRTNENQRIVALPSDVYHLILKHLFPMILHPDDIPRLDLVSKDLRKCFINEDGSPNATALRFVMPDRFRRFTYDEENPLDFFKNIIASIDGVALTLLFVGHKIPRVKTRSELMSLYDFEANPTIGYNYKNDDAILCEFLSVIGESLHDDSKEKITSIRDLQKRIYRPLSFPSFPSFFRFSLKQYDLLQLLWSSWRDGSFDIHELDRSGCTVLQTIEYWPLPILQLVISLGVDPCIVDNFGTSAFVERILQEYFVDHGNCYNILQIFLDAGVDPNSVINDEGESVMHLVTSCRVLDDSLLMEEFDQLGYAQDVDWNGQDDGGRTLLHYALKFGSSLEFIAWLLDHGVDPTIKNNKGKIPRQLLSSSRRIREDHGELVQLLEQAEHRLA